MTRCVAVGNRWGGYTWLSFTWLYLHGGALLSGAKAVGLADSPNCEPPKREDGTEDRRRRGEEKL